MSWTYSCPHCSAMLNPDETIVLVAQQGETRIMVGLHPEPGNYELSLPPGVDLEEGSRWDFSCPVCHEGLVTEFNPKLCALIAHAGGTRGRVLFSCIAGDQATFVVSSEGILEHHGRDVEKYKAEMAQMKYLL